MSLKQTPSQTIGPFFAYSLAAPQYGYAHDGICSGRLAEDPVSGERIRIVGRVLDGAGNPVSDALVEIWQADPEGRYPHPADRRGANASFHGFGRFGTGTDPENRFTFDTVKPGSVDGEQAPHVSVILFMRGMLSHAYTRIYFADEPEANARDPVLRSVPAERRGTLIARSEEPATYRFDIVMQGDNETVFFDV